MFLYISLPSPAKQQREMTKLKGFLAEREDIAVNVSFSFPTWTPFPWIKLPHTSPTMYKLNELE